MPRRSTKKFIDKKNSVTFQLVHRSQKDPLIADETAPQRVLVPIDETQAAKHEKKTLDNKLNLDKRKEEQQKYGIYFDDDYDYLQHLKDVNSLPVEWQCVKYTTSKDEKKSTPNLSLPSSVFASNVEEKVGLLNKAAPVSGLRLDLDPDIVAGLDDDFDFNNPDNELEDNFMELANGESDDSEFSEDEGSEYEEDESGDQKLHASFNNCKNASDNEEDDDVCSLKGPQYTFRDEETKSRFTEYSISSSVIRRNKQLSLLDDKFERMYAAYDEVEIGALDCDEIEGYIDCDSDIILDYATKFERSCNEDAENLTQLMKDKLKVIEREYSSSDENDLENLMTEPRKKDKWDCESILTTYSNIYNHPKLIVESTKGLRKVKVNLRTGIPKDEFHRPGRKLTSKVLAQFDLQNEAAKPHSCQSIAETMKSTYSILSTRPRGESSKKRKERKKELKCYRLERRKERKINKQAFKEEKKRQEKIFLNTRKNIQGNHIF